MTTMTNELLVAGFSVKKVNYDPFESGAIQMALLANKAQREIWSFINEHEEGTLCFNDSIKIEFSEFIDYHLLNLAFRALIQKHDALRMIFNSSGRLVSVKEQSSSTLIYHDFSHLQEAEEFLKEMCVKEVLVPFDLENGPCVRGYFIKLKNDRSVLILSVHRIICDHRSLRILLNDFALSYSLLLLGKKTFTSLPASLNYSLAKDVNVGRKIFDNSNDFNLFKAKQLPTDFERPLIKRFRSKRLDFKIPESTVRSIKELCNIEKCSLENTLIAALSVLISRLTHSDEILIGLETSSHLSSSEGQLIGQLERILPLRIHLAQTENFKMLLKEVRKKMSHSFDDKDMLIAHAKTELNPSCEIVFNFEQFLNFDELLFGKVKTSYLTIAREHERVEIYIKAMLIGNELTLECQYNSELYEISSITNWLQVYAELLSSLSEFKTETIEKILFKKIKIPEPKKNSH